MEDTGEFAFANNRLTSVTFPADGRMTTIGDGAFSVNSLKSVAIPSGVQSIGWSAFGNNLLTSVKLPASLDTIGNLAFTNNLLTSVTIPAAVTTLGRSVFSQNRLTSVSIPAAVENIGIAAFADNRLTAVTIPAGVQTIDAYAFSNNLLTSVTIPTTVAIIGLEAFSDNLLTSVSMPGGVRAIDGLAFYNNRLTSVTIPSTVDSIAEGAFADNATLTSVLFTGRSPAIFSAVDSLGSFGDDPSGLTIYYLEANANSFTATWNGYTTAQAQNFTPVDPTITGTKTSGSTLTAVTTGWAPTANVAFSYVWSRATSVGDVPTPIAGAKSKTYKLTTADKGKYITVTVTSKKVGFIDASRTSAAGGTKIAG
jgi:hypothetical protein